MQSFFLFSEKHFFPRFFPSVFGNIGLQVQDELQQKAPLRPARRKMAVDLLGWSQGAHNAEK